MGTTAPIIAINGFNLDQCFSGGSYWDGTIEITAIDATHVTFTLAGTSDIFSFTPQGNTDGTYTALRCF